MILIISTCKEKLHDAEFVKPVEKILLENKIKFCTKNYNELKNSDIKNSEKIILTGTSLKDNEFLKHLRKFSWIKNCKTPLLGICAGIHIISLVMDSKIKLKKKTEIGYYSEFFKRDFLGLKGKHEVYHLHNHYTNLPKGFTNFTNSKIPQAIKHISKPLYGVLFHPEVRNKKLIEEFCKL